MKKMKKTNIIAIITICAIIAVGLIIRSPTNTRAGLRAEMFELLPEMPDDFEKMKVLVSHNIIKDISRVDAEYWIQPEWYPEFEKSCPQLIKKYEKDGTTTRWGAHGYGCFPSDSSVTVHPDDEFSVYTYFGTACFVSTYQGIDLIATYPASAKIAEGFTLPDGSKQVQQNPDEVKKYFDVEFKLYNPYTGITEPPFVLTPTYPKYTPGYRYRVQMKVHVKPGTPKGNYVIGMDVGQTPDCQCLTDEEASAKKYMKRTTWNKPCGENKYCYNFDQEMYWKYKNLYTTGGMWTIGRPYYQVFVTVV